METEQAKHETQESLIAPPFGTPCGIPNKLQNGCQSSEEDSPLFRRDSNWITSPAQFNSNKGSNSVKRLRENGNSPAPDQGLFDQGSYKMNGDLKNGELKHALTEQTLLHQPKKMKVDGENNENDGASSNIGNSPELENAIAFENSSTQREFGLGKRKGNCQNGEMYCPSLNKQIPNGGMSPSSSIENLPGDLLEKTLSQFYPEQVSIASQMSVPQLDTVNGSLTNQLSSEGAQSSVLDSRFPGSGQMFNAHQQQTGAGRHNEEGVNSYGNHLVNGFSSKFPVDPYQFPEVDEPLQSQRDQQLRLPSARMALGNNARNSQEYPNGIDNLKDDFNLQSTCTISQQEKDHVSFMRANGAPQTVEEGLSKSGADHTGQKMKHEPGHFLQHSTDKDYQYKGQTQNFQGNEEKRHSSDVMGHLEPNGQHPHHTGKENGRGWMEGNPSYAQQRLAGGSISETQEQNMWRGPSPKLHPRHNTASPKMDLQIRDPSLRQRFQTQKMFSHSNSAANSTSLQKQDNSVSNQSEFISAQHNTATKWQSTTPKAPNEMFPQQNFPPNQQMKNYPREPQHLSKDSEHPDPMSPEFTRTQQLQHCKLQRPLSHPPQFEEQRIKSPNYRPHSQPALGQHLPHPNQSLSNNSPAPNNNTEPKGHITFPCAAEMQLSQHQRQYPSSPDTQTFPPHPPSNHFRETNQVEFLHTSSAQSQCHLPQGALTQQMSNQMHLKAEQQLRMPCTQFQRGPQLPLRPESPHGDFQRHAALRMHLLQRQERHGLFPNSQGSCELKQTQRTVKIENEPRFEQQEHLLEPDKGGVKIKQEQHQIQCNQSKSQDSILASMEQSLRQYQLSPVFEKKAFAFNSSHKVKVESSGPVTILSTNTDMSCAESSVPASSGMALKKSLDFTPKKEQLLQSFMDSPMKLLDTPIKNLLDTPMKTQYDIASCHCVDQIIEKDEGPYYTHLGSAATVAGIREMMEKRSGLTGKAIRIEKVIYTGKEGKSTQGCPIAKWIIRRSSVDEKLLVLVRERTGHRCESACIIVVILVWEGIQASLADRLYLELSDTLRKNGALTQRRCAFNEERTCACQGLDPEACGASFSFGCSWSMYYNGCKFARSKIPRKFKLLGDDVREEERVEHNFQNLATLLGPLYKAMAPEAYANQVEHEHRAPDCRLGLKEGRPFSGVTACLDFCAHAHRDLHNMQGGSTVVCTLTREDNRQIGTIPEDEQLHVLPLYKASNTDEFGSEEGQLEKINSGGIQVLTTFRRQIRMLAEPAKSCRQKKLEAKKAAANKNATSDNSNDKAEKAGLGKSKAGTYENTVQNTPLSGPIPGAVGATLQSPGHLSHPLAAHPHQQHQGMIPPYPGSAHAGFMRFPNHPGSFPSTSTPSNMCPPQPPTPASPYPSPMSVSNSYMNGPNRPYPGYQCNGGMPIDSCHPFYAANQKHLNLYQQQRPALYPDQQYGLHQRYDVNYPPKYGDPGLQMNGYNGMRPAHNMRPYSPYGSSRPLDSQFLDPLARVPSVHGGLDYYPGAGKGNQLGDYPNAYLPQSPHVLPPGLDHFHTQVKTEMGISDAQLLSAQLRGGCLNPDPQSGLGLPNGGVPGSNLKQEPGTPKTPTTPQKPEIWSDNEHNFLDPEIGGVAVAPSHGSVLIECAKRELHATTPVKNPDRNHPTRISLVFYQHKNLNEAKHGLALWEAKMAEKAREKEEEAERNGGEGTPSKGNKKGVKREHPESSEPTGEPPYKRFIKALMEGSLSSTSNTYVNTSPYAFTKVTGPYNRFV